MHYEFPVIRNIEDVIPHIDDSFVVRKGDCGNTYINYGKQWHVDQFPLADALTGKIRRECRGIAFDTSTGTIVSRPFHKFFNLDERPDAGFVDEAHTVLEKLDGSMVRPVPVEGGIRWATRAGITEVAMQAETFVASLPKLNGVYSDYYQFAKECLYENLTPIFEYMGPENRVVLEYPEEMMVLLALRDNVSGEYLDASDWCKELDIPYVQQSEYTHENVKGVEGIEGIVIRYDNGHMLKVKGDWYVKLHRAKEYLNNPRRLIEVILDDQVDDLLPAFMPEDQEKVNKIREQFWSKFGDIAQELEEHNNTSKYLFQTKKDYAISRKEESQFKRNYVFQRWDDKVSSAADYLENWVRANLSSAKFSNIEERFGLNA